MRFNSLAFRLFTTAATWTLLVLPIAGCIIYGLYRDDVQASLDGRLQKPVNAVTVDGVGTGEAPPPTRQTLRAAHEVTRSGWYWQGAPIDAPAGGSSSPPRSRLAPCPPPPPSAIVPRSLRCALDERKGPHGRAPAPRRGDRHARAGARQAALPHRRRPRGTASTSSSPISATASTTALTLAGLGLVAVTLFQVRFGCSAAPERDGLPAIRSGAATGLEGGLPGEIEPLQSGLNALIRRTRRSSIARPPRSGTRACPEDAARRHHQRGARRQDGARRQGRRAGASHQRDDGRRHLDRSRMAAPSA